MRATIHGMISEEKLESLDTKLAKYFERHASQCLVRALLACLAVSTFTAAITFFASNNKTLAIIVFGGCAVLSLNASFIFFVPSSKRRNESRKVMLSAAKDPSLIDDLKPGVIAVRMLSGETRQFKAIEAKIWKELVVPYLCKIHSSTVAEQKAETGRVMTKSEIRQLNEQREALEEAQIRLAQGEESLNAAKKDIELQAKSLQDAEELVISRLSEIEVAEAEMAQMRDDLNAAQLGSTSNSEQDERLQRKEAELDALRTSLEEDKKAVETQKTELNQLKGDLIRGQQPHDGPQVETNQSIAQRERELESQMRQLKEAQQKLEERSQYVDEVENSLIDRLNQMSEREAHVEQSEINAGLRMD
ncbi:MAG: hypothetical protein ACPGES_09515 [Coraliomargarita sp.]